MSFQEEYDSFEDMRSINQELTFEATKKEFDLRRVPFGPSQLKTLKLVSPDGLYTNLGLLLSEQCPYTIKAAYFKEPIKIYLKIVENSPVRLCNK